MLVAPTGSTILFLKEELLREKSLFTQFFSKVML